MQPEVSSFFGVLSDPTRARLLEVLAGQTGDQVLCVCALAGALGVTQPAVSQHLRILRGLGLVRPERRGLRVHYLLDRERLAEWHQAVDDYLNGIADERQPSSISPCCSAHTGCPAQHERAGAAPV